MKKWFKFIIIIFSICYTTIFAQYDSAKINILTREQILLMTQEELLDLPFDALLVLANKLGVSVDDLLNLKIAVGTETELTPRELPGIISVITSDEIRKTGARDLLDILRLVPGISFGHDIDGVLGLSMRGNWGLEGKILVLLDGQEINEGLYSSVNFGRHFPVENIKRIEIIRGAGSAMYGGYAELGVINIITKSFEDINGLSGSVTYGQMPTIRGNTAAGITSGFKIKENTITFHGFYSNGNRSDKTITDNYGDEYNLGDNYSACSEKNVNIGFTSKPFNARFIYDDYATNIIQYSENAVHRFQNIMGELNQTYQINKKLSLTPRIKFKSQLPYNLEEEDWFYRKRVNRLKGNLLVKYNPTKKMNLLGGFDSYMDKAIDLDDDSETVFYPKETEKISFYNHAFFLQGIYTTKFFNFIAGGRIDIHNQAGTALSPRLGITGIVNAFHYKLLYSQSFRAPSVENISLNTEIVPEKTGMLELEAGIRITSNFFITANLFDITIKDPIIYIYGIDENDEEYEMYENFNKSGSRGIEVEARTVFQKFCLSASYSLYSAAGKNEVGIYQAIQEDGSVNKYALQGFPNHKFSVNTSYNIIPNLIISMNALYEGKKYGIASGDTTSSAFDPTLLLNLMLEYRNIARKGLSVSVGFHNLLNQDIWFIQPYGSAESPYYSYPDGSREFMIRLRYDIRWKK